MAVEQKSKKKPTRKKKESKPAPPQMEAGPVLPTDSGRSGLLHLIDCTCILPQYLKQEVPTFHKFIAFSVIDGGEVQEKFMQCNNCGIVHRIHDICKSEVVYGRDESVSSANIQDITFSLPSKLSELLEAYSCELPTWEYMKFIVEEKQWGTDIILSIEIIDGRRVGKFARIAGPDSIGIAQYNEVVDFGTSRQS